MTLPLRLLLWLYLITATACGPKRIHPAPAELPPEPTLVRADLHWPIDMRPPWQRRGGDLPGMPVPLPQVEYGDQGLEPGMAPLVAAAVISGVRAAGVDPNGADTDLSIEVFVLQHVGRTDLSDAQWVSTATGGIAGIVGKLIYPKFAIVETQLRLVYTFPDGRQVVRDTWDVRVNGRRTVAWWPGWQLYRRSPTADAFTELFAASHLATATQVRSITAQVLAGEEPSAGIAPLRMVQHSLSSSVNTIDSLRSPATRTREDRKKYPNPHLSVFTGHHLKRGEVVGRIGIPLETLGYDLAFLDWLHGTIDLTVLGIFNSAAVGIRFRPIVRERFSVGLELKVGAYLGLQFTDGFQTVVGGSRVGATGVVAWKPGSITLFTRGGVETLNVQREIARFPELQNGSVVGWRASAGAEFQLSQTTALAVELLALAQFQDGMALSTGLGPWLFTPQVGFGFR